MRFYSWLIDSELFVIAYNIALDIKGITICKIKGHDWYRSVHQPHWFQCERCMKPGARVDSWVRP